MHVTRQIEGTQSYSELGLVPEISLTIYFRFIPCKVTLHFLRGFTIGFCNQIRWHSLLLSELEIGTVRTIDEKHVRVIRKWLG